MKNHKSLFLVLLFISSLIFLFDNTEAQTGQQIANQLRKEGITTQQDINAELKKRGMSQADAQRLAKQYGINYDTFIKTYIMGGKKSSSVNQLSTLRTLPVKTLKSDTTKSLPKIKTTIKPKIAKIKKAVSNVKISKKLKYFGYNIFKNMPGAFKPVEVGPVNPGYLIGPGDVLRLYMWGSVELQYELTVDNQGTIFIPTVGQVFVSGIRYKNLQKKLTKYISKFYNGLAKNPPTIFLDVTLAKLKPIKIFVLGEVAKPGGYIISSFANVFNALYSFGGPLTTGSLRNIRVIRNGKVIATVDLYDYLLKGKLIGDVRLQDNDLIFIPPRGKTVTIKGQILRPAIYELKKGENLRKLIKFAGGLEATAYLGRAQITRIIPFNEREKYQFERKIIDVDLTNVVNGNKDIHLFDGDTLTIFPILKNVKNYVKISGAVYRPGMYELNKVPTVKKLIAEAFGVKPDVYYQKADIMRTRPDSTYKFITINLKKALDNDPADNIKLEPRDSVKIYSIYDVVSRKTVSISGYVKHDVTLPYADSLTLYDMVFKAGGLQDPYFRGKAFMLRGDLIRINPDGYTTRIIPFDLGKLLNDKAANIDLYPGDKIHIYKKSVDKILNKYVTIKGQVHKPGKYFLDTNMTVTDLILRAGGFTEASDRSMAYVSRINPHGFKGDTLSIVYSVPLPKAFLGKNGGLGFEKKYSNNNFKLKYKDIVIIRKNPNYFSQKIVKINGEVKYPGIYILQNKNETFLQLLHKAGGLTSEAFLFGTVYTREGKRLIGDFQRIYKDNNINEDIRIQAGDSVFIPKEPNTVFVNGEVNNPGLYKYRKGWDVKDYIDNAGGVKDSANFVIYRQADGNSQKIGFGLFSSNPEAYDGSIITVTKVPPPKPSVKFDLGATIRDVFAVLSSAVTIIVLIYRLK